jgi:hypothetical protein
MSDEQTNEKQETKVIRFTLAGKRFRVRIEGDLELTSKTNADLIDQLNVIPGRLAYWGAKRAQVESAVDKAMLAFNQWMASMYFKVKDALVKEGEKKPTETLIGNKILVDNVDKHMELKADIRELNESLAIIKGVLKAYEQQVWTLRAIVQMRTHELGSMSDGNLSQL